jgi:hypothetical protein
MYGAFYALIGKVAKRRITSWQFAIARIVIMKMWDDPAYKSAHVVRVKQRHLDQNSKRLYPNASNECTQTQFLKRGCMGALMSTIWHCQNP